ncbi:MAG: outer membrane protein transport protein [Burkholderiales bacterium]|nr:outer membrane protein transport protein [Burkholderiales bacterium]
MKRYRTLISAAVSAAVTGFGCGGALASGFALIEQNASGIGNAYAGQAATAQDASTIFFNPAGMTRLPGRQFVLGGHAIRPSADFSNTGSTPAFTLAPPPLPAGAAFPLGGNGGDGGDWAFVPNAYLSWQVNPNWFIGVGLNAPFGLKTDYDTGWVGRFHGLKSELKTINVNPSVAFKLSDAVSLGAGVSYQRGEAELTRATNYSAAAALAIGGGLVPPLAIPAVGAVAGVPTEGVVKVEGDDDQWGFNLGALFSLGSTTRIGITYRSEIKYTLDGSVSFASRPAALAAIVPDGPVTADLKMPASASWSIFHQLNPKWDLLADISWTQWSSVKTVNIVRSNNSQVLESLVLNWSDSWRFSAGANYHHNGEWTFRFGLAYDQTPSNDVDRTPRIPDQDRTWLALGAQYRISKQAALDVGYAYLFVRDPSINLCTGTASVTPTNVGCRGRNALIGNFDSDVNILSAQLRYSF